MTAPSHQNRFWEDDQVWETSFPAITWFFQAFSSHQNISGRMIKRGKCFPWPPIPPDAYLGGHTNYIWSIHVDWIT